MSQSQPDPDAPIYSDDSTVALQDESIRTYQWITAPDTKEAQAARYAEIFRNNVEMGRLLATMGIVDPAVLDRIQAVIDPDPSATITERPAAAQPKKTPTQNNNGRKSSSDDNGVQPESDEDIPAVVAKKTNTVRQPRQERCILEKAKLLRLTPNDRDSDWASGFVRYLRIMKTDTSSKSMVGLQKLLAHAFSIEGARSLALSAQYARSSSATIKMYKDISATEDARTRFHYSAMAESLAAIVKQTFDNIFSEVSLMVRHIEAAYVYAAFDEELKDVNSVEYAHYKQAAQGNEREFGRLGMRSSRRHYILTQAVRGMFGEHQEGGRASVDEDKKLAKTHYSEMNTHLTTALTLSYLSDAFGPGIHALMIASGWQTMAANAFDDNLPDILQQLSDDSPWLRRIADRAGENVWKFFTDTATWGRMPPQLLNIETMNEKEQLGSNMLSLISLEEQGDGDIEMMG